ncbi:hypothetical protein B484DRAFT_452377 [Ochromonadaceae sp. CCMP2298]|nr:hypothetical protein B484DRAFT_452377 [Ochromonadaceae sp. CCMP2298]
MAQGFARPLLLLLYIAALLHVNVSFVLNPSQAATHRHGDVSLSPLHSFQPGKASWYDMDQCSVLVPREKVPKAVVHFIGGFLAGSQISVAYSSLLSEVANNGFLVVATPIPPIDLNHERVAANAFAAFEKCYLNSVLPLMGPAAQDVPIVGLSHSLGGKLTALIGSDKSLRRRGRLPKRRANVFLAFNNYGLQQQMQATAGQATKASPELGKILEAFNAPGVQRMVQEAMGRGRGGGEGGMGGGGAGGVGDFFQSVAGTAGAGANMPGGASASSATRSFLEAFDQMRGTDAGREAAEAASAAASAAGSAAAAAGGVLGELGKFMPRGAGGEGEGSRGGTGTGGVGEVEFNPSPTETWQRVLQGYNVQRNFLIRFREDEIDQSNEAGQWMLRRGCEARILTVPGNHLTPNVIVPPELLEPAMKIGERFAGQDSRAKNSAQAQLEQQQQDGAAFLGELVGLLNRVADAAWDDLDARGREQYVLPTQSGYGSPRDAGKGENAQWDSDNF